MLKGIILLTSILIISITNVKILYTSEYIQDVFKINDVFLLPSMNTSNPNFITFNYFNDNLFVINNEFNFNEDSISFKLYRSEQNNKFKEYNLIIPREGFSERMFISDIYVLKNSLYLLEFGNLIEFERLSNKYIYKKNYKLNVSCSEILSIDSTSASLSLNGITSDVNKDKEINFIYKVDLISKLHKTINFDNSKFFKLINVGPRKNKVFIDDSTLIFSDIIFYKFNIETPEGIKQFSFNKQNWKSDLVALDSIKVNYKNQKSTFSELMNYNFDNSTIYNLIKIKNLILVKYVSNTNEKKEYNFDLLQYSFKDKSLIIFKENLRNHNLSLMQKYGIEKIEIGRNLKSSGKYLLDLVKFPFSKDSPNENENDRSNICPAERNTGGGGSLPPCGSFLHFKNGGGPCNEENKENSRSNNLVVSSQVVY